MWRKTGRNAHPGVCLCPLLSVTDALDPKKCADICWLTSQHAFWGGKSCGRHPWGAGRFYIQQIQRFDRQNQHGIQRPHSANRALNRALRRQFGEEVAEPFDLRVAVEPGRALRDHIVRDHRVSDRARRHERLAGALQLFNRRLHHLHSAAAASAQGKRERQGQQETVRPDPVWHGPRPF